MSQIFQLKLSRPQREILLAMADHAKSDGTRVFPSVALIAWKTDYSERQVRRIISELKSAQLLIPIAHEKGGRSQITQRGYSTVYDIDLSVCERKEPFRKDDTALSTKSDTALSAKSSYNRHKESSGGISPPVSKKSIHRVETIQRFGLALKNQGLLKISSIGLWSYKISDSTKYDDSISRWIENGEINLPDTFTEEKF